jgi:hypothetical protein
VAIILNHLGRHRYISRGDLASVLPDGRQQLKIESALSESLLALSSKKKSTLCFSSGHGERSPDDLGPEGTLELKKQAELLNFETERMVLDQDNLPSCDLVAIIGPRQPLGEGLEEALIRASDEGLDFLLLLDPVVDADGALLPLGLRSLTEHFGIAQQGGFVLELDDASRLPRGIGEAFLASPSPHPITASLHTDAYRSQKHFVANATQSFELSSGALPLLSTSENATSITDLSHLAGTEKAEAAGEKVIAAISEHEGAKGDSRMVVFGFSSLAESQNLRDPALPGNRDVLYASLAWLQGRPASLGIAPEPPRTTTLPLTEESLQQVLRYVLIYMPTTAVLLGLFVHMRRRRSDHRSRPDVSKAGGQAS